MNLEWVSTREDVEFYVKADGSIGARKRESLACLRFLGPLPDHTNLTDTEITEVARIASEHKGKGVVSSLGAKGLFKSRKAVGRAASVHRSVLDAMDALVVMVSSSKN